MRRPTVIAAVVASFAAAWLLLGSWQIDFPYSIDFQTYWLAGSRVAHGEAGKLYEPGGGRPMGTPQELAAAEFKNVPLVAVAFAPFSALEYLTAKRVFWWLSLGAIVATAWVVGRFLVPEALGPPLARFLGAFAAITLMAPTATALRHGQTTPWVALLVAAWMALLVSGRPGRAGGALALAGLVKFPPLALVALDGARGRWRAVAACAFGLAVAAGVSLALFGPALHRTYAAGVIEQAGAVMTGHNNQSLAAVVTRLSGPAPLHDWTPRPASPAVAWIVGVVALCAAMWAGLGWRKRRDASLARLPFEGLAALSLGTVLLPVAWDHYFLLAAPLLIAAGGALAARKEAWLLGALGVAYGLMAARLPSRVLDRASTSGALDGLAMSHYFLGAVVAIAVAAAALRRS